MVPYVFSTPYDHILTDNKELADYKIKQAADDEYHRWDISEPGLLQEVKNTDSPIQKE